MELTVEQKEGFAKIFKRGVEHYGTVPHGIGHLPDKNEQQIVGYILWNDADAGFTTKEGTTNQEFYIKEDGSVCVLIGDEFKPVNFKNRNWSNFCLSKEKAKVNED